MTCPCIFGHEFNIKNIVFDLTDFRFVSSFFPEKIESRTYCIVYSVEGSITNSSQKVNKLFLLDCLGICVEFRQLSFISLKSPCVNLSSSITIGYFRAKIRHFEYMVRSGTKCAKIQHFWVLISHSSIQSQWSEKDDHHDIFGITMEKAAK